MSSSSSSSSNKDLLKFENEFRNELPVYKEKPKIVPIPRPHALTKKVTEFLANSKIKEESSSSKDQAQVKEEGVDKARRVEMDIFITPDD